MKFKQITLVLAAIGSMFEVIEAQSVADPNAVAVAVTDPATVVNTDTNKTVDVAVADSSPSVQGTTIKTVEEYFVENSIVPDVIPVAPTARAIVTFANGVQASFGNELTPTQVKDIPKVTWDAAPDQYYTLIAIDPDQPSGRLPLYRSTLHWRVVNILGSDLASGATTASYISAAPSSGTGLHRFIFLVYLQPRKIEFKEPQLGRTSTVGRHAFSPENLALKYNLTGPVAGNFFQTAYDSYVSLLYRTLGVSHANAVAPQHLVMVILTLFSVKLFLM